LRERLSWCYNILGGSEQIVVERIPLPKVIMQKDARAHPFPCQIALQTQELIQGTVFYYICADKAAGEFVHHPNGINMLKASVLKDGMQEQEWESGWKYLEKYKELFNRVVFRNALITIRSHWDWYANKLAEFIIFARQSTGAPLMTEELTKLRNITNKEILEQISIMERVCELDFQVSEEAKQNVKEMSLVRNLVLHNRWEVDLKYLNKTSKQNQWQIGDVRTFDSKELILWHSSLIDLINKTWKPVAVKYVSTPKYPLEAD
jgi:hypothetical protein